jgi:thymidylate synthase ThyX
MHHWRNKAVANTANEKINKGNPFINQQSDQQYPTPKGYEYLDTILTDSHGPVYAFNHHIDPVLVGAAMARLSRRAGDMRLTILDEFATEQEQASEIIKRVVSQFGDDSVQQLVGLHVVVEGASNIMTKLLEWGRLAAYLEQSTRYIYFDQKDAHGKFLYLELPHLEPKIAAIYNSTLDEIFETYSKIVRGLSQYIREKNPQGDKPRAAWMAATRAEACDATRGVLPVATRSTVGIFGSAQAIENLIMHLQSESLPEAQRIGQAILAQVRQVMPAFFERADHPKYGLATSAYRANTRHAMRDLAKQYLDQTAPDTASAVRLVDYYPKNELDLVPHLLFDATNLSAANIADQVAAWPDQRKKEVIQAYCGQRLNRRHRPGRAAELANFIWEFDAKAYAEFRDIQRHRMVEGLEWQPLTTTYGYDTPAIIIEAGFEQDFHHCFELSEKLFQDLIGAGYPEEAQYATLFGHKMRYRISMNLREMFHIIELRTSPQGHAGYRAIFQEVYHQLQAVYPTFAQAMEPFVNQSENEALTRMAAEMATEFKLRQLGETRAEEE